MPNSLGTKCSADKDLNPYTKRCNKKCSRGQVRISDPVKRLFKCYKKCPAGSNRRAKTKRCIKPSVLKEIENVLYDLASENQREEEDVQALVQQFSDLIKIRRNNLAEIKKIMDGIQFDDDVKHDLEDILEKQKSNKQKNKTKSRKN
jgi:hypothetical protein